MAESATKCCNTCSQVKPLAEFVKRSSAPDGHAGWCKKCAAAYHRQWRVANPGAAYENMRRWKEAHPDEAQAAARQWRDNNPDVLRGYDRAREERARKQVFAHYGARCACCGTTERLTIDHVNGDGAEHRRELFGDPAQNHGFYRWLVRNGFPPGFQTLCFPCNRNKGKGERCRLDHSEN